MYIYKRQLSGLFQMCKNVQKGYRTNAFTGGNADISSITSSTGIIIEYHKSLVINAPVQELPLLSLNGLLLLAHVHQTSSVESGAFVFPKKGYRPCHPVHDFRNVRTVLQKWTLTMFLIVAVLSLVS